MFTTTLRPGMKSLYVAQLQLELKALGFYGLKVDGSYGPKTKAAVDAFERSRRLSADGIADANTRNVLHTLASRTAPPSTPAGSWKSAPAPAHDYRRVNAYGGKVNARTREMLQRAERYLRAMGVQVPLRVVQGSYHPGYGPSAGTHDGGGVIDVHTRSWPASVGDKIVKALRMAGFAAWRRGTNDSLPPHIHAVAIGDRELSPSARRQVSEYFAGGDGLRGNRPDFHRNTIGRLIPNWARG